MTEEMSIKDFVIDTLIPFAVSDEAFVATEYEDECPRCANFESQNCWDCPLEQNSLEFDSPIAR